MQVSQEAVPRRKFPVSHYTGATFEEFLLLFVDLLRRRRGSVDVPECVHRQAGWLAGRRVSTEHAKKKYRFNESTAALYC